MKTTAFLLDKMPWDEWYRIRIVVPGIDDGAAVHLEYECYGHKRKSSAERLLKKTVAGLSNITISK